MKKFFQTLFLLMAVVLFYSTDLFSQQADAGENTSVCADSVRLSANVPNAGAIGDWLLIGGAGVFINPAAHNTWVKLLGRGANTFQWRINDNGVITTDFVVVTNNNHDVSVSTPTAAICSHQYELTGSDPAGGAGFWTVAGGSGTFNFPSNWNTQVTNIGYGANTFVWTVQKNNCPKSASVEIINNSPSTPNAGADKTTCENFVQLEANTPEIGTGEWSVVSGSGITFDNAQMPTTFVRNLTYGVNTLRWTTIHESCTKQDYVQITSNDFQVSAGIDQTICSDVTQLYADNPNQGSGQWTIISGSGIITNPSLNNTTITNLARGENVFRWEVTRNGCTRFDFVSIFNNMPSPASAGVDQTISSESTTLQGNIPLIGTGGWSLLSGSATIHNPSLHNSLISGIAAGSTIQVRWTTTNALCELFDDVIISRLTFYAYAGIDQTICSNSTTLNANNPAPGTGFWEVIQGSGVFANPSNYNSELTNINPGINILRWTVNVQGFIESDEVTITNNSTTTAIAGGDETVCGENANLLANAPILGNGMWQIIGGSATFETPSHYATAVSNLGFGANTFRWRITNYNCFSTDDVIINRIYSLANAGTDQILCRDYTTLAAAPPTNGTGLWDIISGNAVFQYPSQYNTLVSGLSAGANILRWTVNVNNCTHSDLVTITNNSITPAEAGENQNTCSNST